MAKINFANKNQVASQKRIQVDKNLYLTKTNHDDLVKDLKQKLTDQKEFHENQVSKFTAIDKATYGYLVLEEQDEKRQRDNAKGFGIKPVDTVLPLALVQLDESVTYFLEVLAANSGLYGAIAPKDKQAVATGFAALMNEHADKFQHVRNLNMFLFDAMKYNFGVIGPNWKTIHGSKLTNDTTDSVVVEEDVVYAGNELTAFDPYNFFYDLSVSPIDLAMEGEFFAQARVKSPFKVKQLMKNEELYNLQPLLDKGSFEINWYTAKPKIRTDDINYADNASWFKMLGGVGNTSTTNKAVELMYFHVWLDTKKLGLDPKATKMQICRVIMANNETIARIQILNNAHGQLPIGVSMPIEDGFAEATKSYAELLLPFQTFASSQMNVHQKANRKALYGVTIYNKNVINLDDEFDPTASKIGVNAPPEADLRKAIHQIYDSPDTANTLRDIEAVVNLMQKILPTEILKQVASLDRATQYQAAATVQGANRRNLKLAKIINSQALSPTKQMQMYNILQYQAQLEILTQEGELINISPKEFRDTKLEFEISDGLQGLDRMSITMAIKEVLNTIVQSQHASAQIDVVEIINYWTSMLGDKTDFSQFKFKSEIDKLPPEQKDLAFQLLQQAMAAQGGEGAAGAGG